MVTQCTSRVRINTLYLSYTGSEWSAGQGGFGSGHASAQPNIAETGELQALPFDHCALSMQPFREAVMTSDGFVFDRTYVLLLLL